MLVRGDSLAKSMSHYLIEQIEALDNVEVRTRSEAVAAEGDGRLRALRIRNPDGSDSVEPVDACFVFIGARPLTDWLAGCASRATSAGSSSPDSTSRATAGRFSGTRSRSRRACPECSSPATSARVRSSGWRAPSARDRWRCRSSTNTWPRHESGRRGAGHRRRSQAGRPVRRPRRHRARRVGGGRRAARRRGRGRRPRGKLRVPGAVAPARRDGAAVPTRRRPARAGRAPDRADVDRRRADAHRDPGQRPHGRGRPRSAEP